MVCCVDPCDCGGKSSWPVGGPVTREDLPEFGVIDLPVPTNEIHPPPNPVPNIGSAYAAPACGRCGQYMPYGTVHACYAPGAKQGTSTEVRVTDAKTGGQKGQKAERHDLLPYDALDEVARIYGFGATKYADDNWALGFRWRLSAGALQRHMSLWMQGEDIDKESGYNHLGHVAWHALTLLAFTMRGLGTDDRKKSL